MSPDWSAKQEPVPYAKLDNPQTLNLYGYVGNNPLSRADADGHQEVIPIPVPLSFPVLGPISYFNDSQYQKALADMQSSIDRTQTEIGKDPVMTRAPAAPAVPTGVAGGDANDKANSGPKAAAAPGVTAGGQATDKYGNKIGPSGKPQVNEVDHSGKKGAKDAARNEGKGKPEQHASPKKGDPHFHPTDENGEKQPTSTHHNYPQ